MPNFWACANIQTKQVSLIISKSETTSFLNAGLNLETLMQRRIPKASKFCKLFIAPKHKY